MYLELPDEDSIAATCCSILIYTVEPGYDDIGLYLWSQIFCGNNSFNTVHKNITLLGCNDTK